MIRRARRTRRSWADPSRRSQRSRRRLRGHGRHLDQRDLAAVRPRRDGFVMGEGAGVLVLEALEAARGARRHDARRGARLRRDRGRPPPDGARAGRARRGAAMRARARRRRLRPERGGLRQRARHPTPLNDRAETVALKRRSATAPARAGVVHQVGHRPPARRRRGGGGGRDAARAARADGAAHARLRGGREGSTWTTCRTARGRWHGRQRRAPAIGLSNSFGFGGHNAVYASRGGDEHRSRHEPPEEREADAARAPRRSCATPGSSR